MAHLGIDRIESKISANSTLSSDTSAIIGEDVTTFSSQRRGLDDTFDSEDDTDIERDDDFFDDTSANCKLLFHGVIFFLIIEFLIELMNVLLKDI